VSSRVHILTGRVERTTCFGRVESQLHEPHVCFFPPNVQPAAVRRARDHMVEGLSALMLATKRRPLIRYQSSSEHARSVALDMWRLMYEQEVRNRPRISGRLSEGDTVGDTVRQTQWETQ
jgi:hypothetical protein